MDESERRAIKECHSLIDTQVNKEEIVYYLKEMFPMYQSYFEATEDDLSKSVSDIFIFLKDVDGAFKGICQILSEECSQPFIVKSLKSIVDKYATETDTAPSERRKSLNLPLDCLHMAPADFVYTDLSSEISSKVSTKPSPDILISGPSGSGKSSLVVDVFKNLRKDDFECLILDLYVNRFSSVLGKLETFVGEKVNSDKKVVFLDSCTQPMFLRLNDGSTSSIYSEMKMKGISLIFISNDAEFSLLLENCVEFKMPSCDFNNIKSILKTNFSFSEEKFEALLSGIHQFNHDSLYPVQVILSGSLFVSLKESQFELLNCLPAFEDVEFVEKSLRMIIDVRNSVDDLYVIAAVVIFQDAGGAYLSHLQQLLSKSKYSPELVQQSLESLVDCRLLITYHERYYLRASFVKPLMLIDKFQRIWDIVMVQFCLQYLKYVDIIIESLSDEMKLMKEWESVKNLVIKALTCDVSPKNDEKYKIILDMRCLVTSKLKSLWQSRLLNFAQSVDIYETIASMIKKATDSKFSDKILVWERTILIHYISLFFYFQKVPENTELLSSIFMDVDSVNRKLSSPTDDLFCEFISLIIEYKIQEGKLEDAVRNLKTLIKVQDTLDTPRDHVTLNKIRLAQLKILQNGKYDSEGDEILNENFSSTPLSRPQLINTKIRMSRGDFYYMKNDFVSTAWNYEMALYSIDELVPENPFMSNEINKVMQNIHCRLGMLGLQSGDTSECSKSLVNFHKCQEFYESIENGSKYHKYLIYSAVTHILMGNTDKALYDVLEYIKHSPHKPMFVAVTDRSVQEIISRNLQERMGGNELQFIDNHVYQGKVNFLHLTSVNYNWVKCQANDEIIEIDVKIPEKQVRANVLQFPDQRSQSNKCLVVVFLESQHQRMFSDRTNISEQTNVSLSSFNSKIVDYEGEASETEDTVVDEQSNHSNKIINSVYNNSLTFAREILDKAKASFFQNLTSSIVDQIF